MKNIYSLLFSILILIIYITRLSANPSNVEKIEFNPDLFFVGDRVELRITVKTEKILSKPILEEFGPWLRVFSTNTTQISDLIWEVRIIFSNYQPGIITFPAINLGPVKIENIQAQAASVLPNDYADSEIMSPLRKQLRLPKSLIVYLSLLLSTLIVPFIVVKLIIKVLRFLKLWHEERARNLPGKLLLTELSRIHGKYRTKTSTEDDMLKFYVQLSSAIREYLSKKLDIYGHASTTYELSLEVSRLGLSSEYVRSITRILEAADQVKFAADYSSKKDIDDIILSLLPSIINNIDSIIERRSTNVES